MSPSTDLWQRCRRSSAFDSDRLNVAQNTFRTLEMVGKNVRGSFFFFSLCAFAHVRFSMFGEQIKPLEPRDKSDRRNKEGAVRRDERAQQKC